MISRISAIATTEKFPYPSLEMPGQYASQYSLEEFAHCNWNTKLGLAGSLLKAQDPCSKGRVTATRWLLGSPWCLEEVNTLWCNLCEMKITSNWRAGIKISPICKQSNCHILEAYNYSIKCHRLGTLQQERGLPWASGAIVAPGCVPM